MNINFVSQAYVKFLALVGFLTIIFMVIISCTDSSSKIQEDSSKVQESDFYLGGIQVNEPDHKEWVSTLKDVGMNTVSVTVYARQGIWNSDNLWWEEEDESVINEIRAAKAEGMKVVLILRVSIDHYFKENKFLWHGMTMPANDTLLVNWFHWYGVFVDKWAQISESEGVDVLAIGSEMRQLSATQPIAEIPGLETFHLDPIKQKEYIADRMRFKDQIPPEDIWVRGEKSNYTLEKYLKDEVVAKEIWAKSVAFQDASNPIQTINKSRAFKLKQWYKLIEKVRKSYSGKLTYAANFDNYQNVKFWDKLDFIGINAYFKLRDFQANVEETKMTNEIEASWDRVFRELKKFRAQESLEQKAIFTELGYVYRENCTIMPWEGFGFSIVQSNQQKNLIVWRQQKLNKNERKIAVEALYKTNQKYNLLNGILYWKLTTKDYHIPYEPFVLHITKEGNDPMQKALVQFLQ